MNQTQIKYIRQRIEEINNTKRAAIKSKYIYVKPVLTLEEKITLIQKGEYEVKKSYASYGTNSLDCMLVFGGEDNPNLKQESEAYKKLQDDKTKLLDNLILGDSETLLSALLEFEKEEY